MGLATIQGKIEGMIEETIAATLASAGSNPDTPVYICRLAGGTIPFMRRYTTIWP
jgi:hypothetical protein